AELKGQIKSRRRRKRPEGSVNLMRSVVNRFQLLKSSQVASTLSLLNEAGWRSKDAIIIYMFFTLVLPIALGVIGLTLFSLDIWGDGKGAVFKYAAPVGAVYLGLKLPYWVSAQRRQRRYVHVQRALSDTLDLMTICAEAGLTLSVALERVSRELGLTYPE